MVSYATSEVPGLQELFPLQTVRLPLKYPANETQVASSNSHETYATQLASSGHVVMVEENSYIDFVTFGIRNKGLTLLLTPVSRSNVSGLSFRTINIELPHAVYSKECVSVRYSSLEKAMVVDFVTKTFLFVTLKIRLQDFVLGKLLSSIFPLDEFDQWGHISVPFSFELKSSPFSIKALDDSNIIVSLKDGGLLHFERSSPLHDFDVYSFMDGSSLMSLNLLEMFWSKKGGKTRNSSTNVEGISSMAVVDLVPINEKVFVTLSISKEVNCWSLESHAEVSGSFHLGSATNSNFWLSMIPRKYMQIVTGDGGSNGKRYLVLHYSLPHDDISGYSFSVWEIVDSEGNFELIKLDNMLINLTSPKSIFNNHRQDNLHNLNWYIQDFQTVYSGKENSVFDVNILWKSNSLSVLATYDVVFPTGEVLDIKWSNTSTAQNTIFRPTVLDEFLPYRDLKYFQWKILKSGIYDKRTILSALDIFRHHADLASRDKSSTDDSIIGGLLYETMVATHKTKEYDLKTCWYKFDALCEELKRTELETLALDVVSSSSSSSGSTLVSYLSNGLMEYRESHLFEEFLDSGNPLCSILNNLTTLLSSKSLYKIYESVIQLSNSQGSLSGSDATELYQSILALKIQVEESQKLQEELQAIPQIDELIQSFFDLKHSRTCSSQSFSSSSSTPSEYQKLIFMNSISKLEQSHEITLLGLLILFLVSELDDDVLGVINQIVEVLANYTKLNVVVGTSVVNSSVTTNVLGKASLSILWEIISTSPKLTQLVTDGQNSGFQKLIEFVNGSNSEFVLDVILGLIGHNGGLLIEEEFFSKLSPSEPTDQFLKGLVYLIDGKPQEMFKVFSQVPPLALPKGIIDKLRSKLQSNKAISQFLADCFDGPVSYYHSLAHLAKEYAITNKASPQDPNSSSLSTEYLKISIAFEFLAIEQLNHSGDVGANITDRNSYYINIFEMGLGINDYDVVLESLGNLKLTFDYESYVQKYIGRLASTNQLDQLFHRQPVTSNYLLIDRILVSLAEAETDDVMRALIIHKAIFSWRLFGGGNNIKDYNTLVDTRGACESLYWFIVRYRQQSTWKIDDDPKATKLKVLELYLIIVNCIKSFEKDDDRWLISMGKLITLSQISNEYYSWFKELENDIL
ncbi:uncharacterized protein KQ657_003804 [Scheffersomyces spartinae]|uniref:Nucleoporin Nup120/160 beta-propeller domain-containing protein n=1 Tax=Scheffersomyces spartinae TaxID=45513 RepID=A0A9P7VC19_9ASCO|nr:uncharacterized protein KQ657_003804 [Scheffersomyces spartinae]KAG7195278.1 hypothetical protein KQ657_003804 [Scheffersomyces spartinae]